MSAPLIESFVVAELAKQLGWAEADARIFHYRDRDQREIDVVLEGPPGQVAGVEVKASTSARHDDTRSLRYLRDRLDSLGENFVAGVVFHTGQNRSRLDDRIVGLPISDLLA